MKRALLMLAIAALSGDACQQRLADKLTQATNTTGPECEQ